MGLKCAPLMGPNNAMSVASTATVASVFASSASAAFPPASPSAMMPEPITQAASSMAPRDSARIRAATSGHFIRGPHGTDVAQAFLQLDAIQRLQRKTGKDLHAAFQFMEGLAKRQPLFGDRKSTRL